jgi:hypothetical protein
MTMQQATHPLDAPFEDLKFQLPCNGKTYTVTVEYLHSQPLYAGLMMFSLEHMPPEEIDPMFADFHKHEKKAFRDLEKHLTKLWEPIEAPWAVLTPVPDQRSREFRYGQRLSLRLCAAVLESQDAGFPLAGEMDYSQARIIYTAMQSEGLLPQRIRSLIDWEQAARPCSF